MLNDDGGEIDRTTKLKKTPEGIELQVSEKALDPNATVIKLEILGEPKVIAI